MDNTLYEYSPITERPAIEWPGGARVAVYLGLNIEHFLLGRPSTSIWPGTADLVPDPLNHGWRDYGARVGIWRTVQSLDRHGFRASVLLNSDAARHYPQIVEAGVERDWAWLAHGRTNSVLHANLTEAEERAELGEIVDTIATATGRRPRGWMGPGLTETLNTPRLLAELGLDYVLDWTNDDQPYRLTVPGMISVPYTVELNDINLFVSKSTPGPEFVRIVRDQYEQLRADGGGRVMAIALHPFVIGQAFRARYLDEALEFLAAQPDAWLTTSDDIAAHYLGSSRRPLETKPPDGVTVRCSAKWCRRSGTDFPERRRKVMTSTPYGSDENAERQDTMNGDQGGFGEQSGNGGYGSEESEREGYGGGSNQGDSYGGGSERESEGGYGGGAERESGGGYGGGSERESEGGYGGGSDRGDSFGGGSDRESEGGYGGSGVSEGRGSDEFGQGEGQEAGEGRGYREESESNY